METRTPISTTHSHSNTPSSQRKTALANVSDTYNSGALVERDQNRSLWFLNDARKIKGLAETRCVEFAEQHKDV